jgi:hypothetical protein
LHAAIATFFIVVMGCLGVGLGVALGFGFVFLPFTLTSTPSFLALRLRSCIVWFPLLLLLLLAAFVAGRGESRRFGVIISIVFVWFDVNHFTQSVQIFLRHNSNNSKGGEREERRGKISNIHPAQPKSLRNATCFSEHAMHSTPRSLSAFLISFIVMDSMPSLLAATTRPAHSNTAKVATCIVFSPEFFISFHAALRQEIDFIVPWIFRLHL